MILHWFARVLKGLVLLAVTLILLAAAGGAAFWWWAGTEGSLDWTLRQLGRWQPVQAEGVRGSLRAGLAVDRLRWQQDGLQVEAREVRLEWKPLALLTGGLQLDEVRARSVRIEDRRPPQPRGAAPTSLALPVHPAIDDLQVGTIEWVTPANSVVANDLVAHYNFNGVQHQLQVDQVRWQSGTYRGRASVGARGALHVNATLEGRFPAAVPGGGAQALPLDFSASLLGPLADLQAKARLQVGTGSPAAGTRANATAQLTPWAAQPVPQAQGEFQQLDLHALWDQAPQTALSGQVRVQPAGTATWSLTADLANEKPGPWDQGRLPVGKVSAQGEWRGGGQALVRHLQAQVGGGQLQAKGQWQGAGGWEVQGRLDGVDPAAVYSALAAVPVSGSADLHGEGRAISFAVDLAAARAAQRRRQGGAAGAVQALELRQATARGRWDGALLALPAFDVRTADARLRGSLQLRPKALAGNGQVTLEAPGLRASADGQLAAASGAGNLQLQVPDAARALRWVRQLPQAAALVGTLAASGRGELRAAWQGGWRDPAVQARLGVPLLEAAAPAAGAGPGGPAWSVRDAVLNVDGRLSDAKLQGRARAEFGQRRVALELAAQGGRRGARPAVWQAQLHELRASATDPSLGAGPWTLTLQQPVSLRWADGSLDAGAGQAVLLPPAGPQRPAAATPATLAWDPVHWGGGELRTAGRLGGLPMAWIELLGGPQLAGSALAGDLVFDAQWDAALGATPRVRASLARRSGDVTVLAEGADGGSSRVAAGVREARLALESDGEAIRLSLRWDSERAGVAQGELASRLAPGGAAGWQWPESAPLDGTLRAQLPRIGVWSLLAPPGWRLRGSLGANVRVGGTRGDPQLSGTLVADDLALRSIVDGVELQGGRLRARLDGRRLVVDEFMLRGSEAAGGGGTLVATGEGTWTGDGPQARLAVRLDRLRGSIRSDRQLTVSGELAASVDAAATELTGRLKVDSARILLPEESAPQLGDDVVVRGAATRPTRSQARAAEPQRTDGRRLRLDVALDLGDDFRVQGHGIATRLAGTLQVTGQSLTAPRLAGSIRTVGGEYRAYGQWLDIERGVLRFTGPVDNPSLDILAIRPNMLQRVGVQITGNVLNPYVRLYSQPPLPDAEKLSWLILGRASASGGAEAALVQQAALALLASRSGQGGGKGIAGSLGLDQLSFSRDGAEGPAVTLGKRLGRNFYAAYERSLSGAIGTLFIFYDLTRRITIRAEAGERTAIDLILTFTAK